MTPRARCLFVSLLISLFINTTNLRYNFITKSKSTYTNNMSASRLAKTAIKIPKYIERGPTDILRALSATVTYLPKEPHYSLVDDPYLLPRNYTLKKNYLLAKISGQKTAKFILNKHPELFFRDDAEPKVEAFCHPEEFNSDMNLTEEDLKWCITNNDPVNGIIAYESLEKKQSKISDEVLMQFFELICFTNEQNIFDPLEYERSRVHLNSLDLVDMSWRTTGLASKIFNQIKDDLDPPRVYSAMIAGLCKFNEHSAAKQVFDNFREFHPNQGLYVNAYDGLLRSAKKLNSSASSLSEALQDIVGHMGANLVRPNVQIFNSILECSLQQNMDQELCEQNFRLINDMRSLNIDPSLATFVILTHIIVKLKVGRIYGEIIPDLLRYIESHPESLEIRDDRDPEFFEDLMYQLCTKLNNLSLANRIHKLYIRHPHIISSERAISKYFNCYFRLILTADTWENIMQFYEDYVPYSFRPNADCYDILAENLDLYQASEELVRKIGEDIINFDLAHKVTNDQIFRRDPSYVAASEERKSRR